MKNIFCVVIGGLSVVILFLAILVGILQRPLDFDIVKLIETHCHAELNNKVLIEPLLTLQRREQLTYALFIIKDWDNLLPVARKHKNYAGALLYVDPTVKQYQTKVEKAVQENGDIIKGFKLNPSKGGYSVTVDLLAPLFNFANQHDFVIVTHTDVTTPADRYRPLLTQYPQTKLILYHSFPPQAAFELVNTFPNVYIDTSYTAFNEALQQSALQIIGRQKIVFGIDSPLGFPENNGTYLPHYRNAAKQLAAFYHHDRKTIEHIFFKNAQRLFHLPDN